MREGKPSQTAALVALLRALANLGLTHVPGFADPTAEQLLPSAWSFLFEHLKRRYQQSPGRKGWQQAKRAGDILALRTVTIDAHLRDALNRGIRQLVILGAGLDGRAYRLASLAATDVFEVDHPATQQWKRERAAALKPLAKALHFVPVNFERDSLEIALQKAGQALNQPSVWIWEGVVMYLTDAAMRATLCVIATRSAPGSVLIIQYNTRGRGASGTSLLLRLWGEPQRAPRSQAAMEGELTRVGYRVIVDSSLSDWSVRFGTPVAVDPSQGARIVVAERTA
jgi:methyltransferase (TIGR00027 family)